MDLVLVRTCVAFSGISIAAPGVIPQSHCAPHVGQESPMSTIASGHFACGAFVWNRGMGNALCSVFSQAHDFRKSNLIDAFLPCS
jgi:hypothetical protein